MAAQGLFKSARGSPFFSPGMMYGLPATRGNLQDAHRDIREVKRFATCFRVGKKHHPALPVDVSHLASRISRRRAPSQHQQTDCRDCVRV